MLSEYLLLLVARTYLEHHPRTFVLTRLSSPVALSCFDERLLEDSRINRLEDSFLLWRSVCSSRLLRKASLILFMNKCDLLRRKLKAGVKVKNYLPSYGDRPNDANTVVRYLKDKFKDIAKSSPEQGGRVTYYYATSVTVRLLFAH